MKPLYYLLQVIVASGILYGYYHLALRNKKFHRYNRFYLLSAVLISILVPFLNIPVYFTPEETASSPVLRTLTTFSSGHSVGLTPAPSSAYHATSSNWFTWTHITYLFYFLVATTVLLRVAYSLRKIRAIAKMNPVEKLDDIRFVNTNEPGTPFSFFRWLFWNRKIELGSVKGEQIFRHEYFHIRERHSLDIITMELLMVIFWINPFFHLIKREIKAIHEFLADRFAVKENDRWEYAELLLMQALNTQSHLVNPFFHNQIKRRIAMITSSSKPGHQYLRKLLVLPIATMVVALFAFTYKNKSAPLTKAKKQITVLIDAGHGGVDPGVKSPDNQFTEAALSLEIAKKIQRMASEYNINVVMTRENEELPGGASTIKEGLKKRADLANQVRPDAFLAIHVNGTSKNGYQSNLSGIEAYISNKRNDIGSRSLAASVLQELAGVYTTNKEIQQREKQGIYILDNTFYPAVLIECGYINNAKDLAFITNKSKQDETARAILKALVAYINADIKEPEKNATPDTTRPPIVEVQLTSQKPTFGPASGWDKYKKTSVTGDNVELMMNNGTTLSMRDVNFNVFQLDDKDTSNHPLQNILYIIDGKEYNDISSFKDLDSKVKPNDISSINIWKDNVAVARFGEKGRNGVIEIFTKSYKEQVVEIKEVTLQDIKQDNSVLYKVEIDPMFPGGESKWKEYLQAKVDETTPVKQGAPSGVYTVVVRFMVDTKGDIHNIEALTKFGYSMEEQVINALKKGPKWLPSVQNGYKVNAYKTQPVTFVVVQKKMPDKDSWTAAVSTPNNMDILFIGVDTPVTISSSEDKAKNPLISISQGSITGSNGKYTVRVVKEGEAVITVSSSTGKSAASFHYKVKPVDPQGAHPRLYLTLVSNPPTDGKATADFKLQFMPSLVHYELISCNITITNDGENTKTFLVKGGSPLPEELRKMAVSYKKNSTVVLEEINARVGDKELKLPSQTYTLNKWVERG